MLVCSYIKLNIPINIRELYTLTIPGCEEQIWGPARSASFEVPQRISDTIFLLPPQRQRERQGKGCWCRRDTQGKVYCTAPPCEGSVCIWLLRCFAILCHSIPVNNVDLKEVPIWREFIAMNVEVGMIEGD